MTPIQMVPPIVDQSIRESRLDDMPSVSSLSTRGDQDGQDLASEGPCVKPPIALIPMLSPEESYTSGWYLLRHVPIRDQG